MHMSEKMETRRKASIFGTCRFCDTEGHHRDLTKEYSYVNGKTEVYCTMFLECFNLFLSTASELSNLICWACITKLKDALAFRSKVAAVEQQLLNSLLDKDTVFVNVPVELTVGHDLQVKSELVRDVKLEHSLTDDEQEIHDIETELDENEMDYESDTPMQFDDVVVKDNIQVTDDNKDLVDGEAEFVAKYHSRDFRLPTRNTLYANSCAGFVNQLDILKGQIVTTKMLQKLLEDSERDVNTRNKGDLYITEKMGHILNALTILQHSNATPFKSKTRSGFPCYYCRNIFENLEKLKDHQSAQHRRTELKKILSGYGAECLVVYADVTDLKCTICNEGIPKLYDLKSHLIKKHNKTMYTEYNDRVIPFKLTATNVYECQICGFNFETFGSIERHMNVHFRNYVCKECGTGFVTKYRLKVHTKSMHVEGSFPCDICKKVFTTQQKQKNHVDTVHKLVKRFKCPKCQERFTEYFRRQKHLVEVHGVAPLEYKCNVCDKSFDRRYTLSRHMKRDHLEERDFQCQMCTYKCFTNNELRVHMIKHNGERVHECSVCKKSYARKKTLREHMRIHNNDRRFACAVCGQAFIQKCSLKGHIKTHHLEYSLQ